MVDEALKKRILERVTGIPIVDMLPMQIVELSEGFCAMRLEREKRYNGVYDSLHGGLMMTVADSAACFAIFTLTGPDVRIATTDMNIRFLAPCLSDMTVKARVIRNGRTLVPVEADLYDADGKHVAVSQVTYIKLNDQ